MALSLKKLDSSIACSTQTCESSVFNAPGRKVWQDVKVLAFDKMLPSFVYSLFTIYYPSKKVEKCEYTIGEPGKIESEVKVTFKDKAEWTFKILEISELHAFITYELVMAEPPIDASSVLSSIKLHKVTDENHTFVIWESIFSNDANAFVL